MKVLKQIITQDDIDTILLHYKDGEYDSYMKKYHGTQIDKLINYSNIYYCDRDNVHLRNIVDNIIHPNESVYAIHMLRYETGDSCKKHTDRSSLKTYIFILTDGFMGGRLLVDDVDTNAVKYDVVVFNGNIEYHEVTEITHGIRDVLVVWTGDSRLDTHII